jgi:hypothetical protein
VTGMATTIVMATATAMGWGQMGTDKNKLKAAWHWWWLHPQTADTPTKAINRRISLILFDAYYVDAPNEGTTRGKSEPYSACMLRTHRERWHNDFGGVADVGLAIDGVALGRWGSRGSSWCRCVVCAFWPRILFSVLCTPHSRRNFQTPNFA